MTALDLIKSALRTLGVLAAGEEPAAADAQDALYTLNDLLDAWNTERLLVYGEIPQTFSLIPGQVSYTMGPAGNFNTARPVRITKCQMWYQADGNATPLNLPITIIDKDQYNRFVVPGTASPIPMWLYPDDSFPLRNLFFYTVPSQVNQVQIWSWAQLQAFAELKSAVSLPAGYKRALRFNLARELAGEYGKSMAATDLLIANEAKAALKSVNSSPSPLLQTDAALIPRSGGFNYLTGE